MKSTMHTTTLAVGAICSALLMASCDRRTVNSDSKMASCASSLEKKSNTATRLLSGKEIDSCIRGKRVVFYRSADLVYLNRNESFLSDGKWVVNRNMAMLDTYVGRWHIDHDKVCTTQIRVGAFCRAILLNQNDKTLFMPQSNETAEDRRWARISIGTSAHEGHMSKR